jgi:hypothetical protein
MKEKGPAKISSSNLNRQNSGGLPGSVYFIAKEVPDLFILISD